MCSNGYSQHGDYVFGWEGDTLQRAMDARCNGAVCSQLKTQSSEEAMKCTKAPVVNEEIDGCKSHLLPICLEDFLWGCFSADHFAGLTAIPGQAM